MINSAKSLITNQKISFKSNPLLSQKQQINFNAYQKDMSDSIANIYKFVINNINKKLTERFKILDIGCCNGTLLRKIRSIYKNCTTFGLELNPQMIEFAINQDNNANLNKNSYYFIENANNIANISEHFDIIIMSKIMHEIYSYDNPILNNKNFLLKSIILILKNLFEKLNKGGNILIRDPAKPMNPNYLFKIENINNKATTSNQNKIGNLSQYELLTNFITNFKPAKHFNITPNKIILPKWLISEFLRHRKFTFNDAIWYDELNEQYGTILPLQFTKIAQKIGYNVKMAKNIGSLLDNKSKYHLDDKDFKIKTLSNKEISKYDFPSNFLAVLQK